jgi:nicotinamidase-related amidase
MMAIGSLSPRSGLLVIDLQVGMFNGERFAPIHAGDRLLSNTQTALGWARRSGIRVIYVRHGGPAGHLLERGTQNWCIHPAIASQDGEMVIDKRTPDAFHETSLMQHPSMEGINRLIVTGAQTEVCVDTTCRRAFSLGFEIALASDGHSTWGNDTLTADQIIEHTNKTLAEWFVQLVHVDEVENWSRQY